MDFLKKIENIILLILWAIALPTYSIALTNSYILGKSDILGLISVLIVTLVSIFSPQNTLKYLLAILILGLFNLLSFLYFFNIVFTFSFSVFFVTPGIQIYSLILLLILFIYRGSQIREIYKKLTRTTEVDIEKNRLEQIEFFKKKFINLSDREIDVHIQNKLVPAAIEALKIIKEERNVEKGNYNNI